MPPWESVEAAQHTCTCGETFMAKRATARFCSKRCQDRSRKPRPYNAEQTKAWRMARLDRPGYREMENAKANARATAIRRWLDAYKTRIGCVDCGFNNPIALDFDHIGDLKSRNVSACKSIAQAEAEITLCEVRCANCHRLKTHERRHAGPSTTS